MQIGYESDEDRITGVPLVLSSGEERPPRPAATSALPRPYRSPSLDSSADAPIASYQPNVFRLSTKELCGLTVAGLPACRSLRTVCLAEATAPAIPACSRAATRLRDDAAVCAALRRSTPCPPDTQADDRGCVHAGAGTERTARAYSARRCGRAGKAYLLLIFSDPRNSVARSPSEILLRKFCAVNDPHPAPVAAARILGCTPCRPPVSAIRALVAGILFSARLYRIAIVLSSAQHSARNQGLASMS